MTLPGHIGDVTWRTNLKKEADWIEIVSLRYNPDSMYIQKTFKEHLEDLLSYLKDIFGISFGYASCVERTMIFNVDHGYSLDLTVYHNPCHTAVSLYTIAKNLLRVIRVLQHESFHARKNKVIKKI